MLSSVEHEKSFITWGPSIIQSYKTDLDSSFGNGKTSLRGKTMYFGLADQAVKQ